eukprot:CAMPEP_0171235236 /NCGR_PEP_ID=MMETSP0790-20130122/41842_1 /TAXON_ID=2925 /ORGANISM="Alexandrium catenella, Strain OF101" /LENGTH=178 /DNA_ID=CAMNT_0011701541 /DNA_START=51 /DNA_END=588 /DNA_ORIENTATION=-
MAAALAPRAVGLAGSARPAAARGSEVGGPGGPAAFQEAPVPELFSAARRRGGLPPEPLLGVDHAGAALLAREWAEAAVVFVVFGLTGSTSVALVRPCFKALTGIDGNLRDGPWSYRIGSLLMVSPVYAAVLITFGTLSGRHLFFAKMGQKILGRFLPPSLRPKLQCAPAQAKTGAGKP